jgi:hypothetical protein
VDKYEVRKYVKETIGEEYLVPLIGIYDDPEDIYFNKLPNQFVLKPTHTSGSVIICRDKNSLDLKQTKKTLAKWMQDNYYWRGREWPYKEVLPRIICEEIISTEDSSLPKDYKLFCFSGIPKVAFVASDRGMDTKFDFYDILWNKLPLSQHYPNSNLDMKKPLQWEEMIKLASKLSKQFPHVRVDFYIDANGYIKFGEMTFYHFSGFQVFEPREYDELFGSWIDLSLVEKNQKKDDNVRK